MTHKIEHFLDISTRIQVRSHPTGCTRAFTDTARWRNGPTVGGLTAYGTLSRVERAVRVAGVTGGVGALGGDDAHPAYIRSRGTILTQMRNSLSRRTINNRDKGFMVARETAAIKVSGCFQSVNSRCHEVGARQRAGAASRHPFPSGAGRAVFAYRRYRRRWTVSAYTRMLHLFALFASNHGIGCFPRRDTLLLHPQKKKNVAASRTLLSHL